MKLHSVSPGLIKPRTSSENEMEQGNKATYLLPNHHTNAHPLGLVCGIRHTFSPQKSSKFNVCLY